MVFSWIDSFAWTGAKIAKNSRQFLVQLAIIRLPEPEHTSLDYSSDAPPEKHIRPHTNQLHSKYVAISAVNMRNQRMSFCGGNLSKSYFKPPRKFHTVMNLLLHYNSSEFRHCEVLRSETRFACWPHTPLRYTVWKWRQERKKTGAARSIESL